jgi:hypothetical protein
MNDNFLANLRIGKKIAGELKQSSARKQKKECGRQ